MVLGSITRLQLVLDCFRWFRVIPRFSKNQTSQCWLRFDVLIFVQKFTPYWLDSQPVQTLEWKLFLKISVHLQASTWPFIWAHVAGPTSYLSENLELPKCWTSEAPHPNCLISNCSTFQTLDIFFHLYENPPVRYVS